LKRECNLPKDVPEYDDWRDLMADGLELDGAVISSPTQFHAEQAIACYERGLPIALEKPVAPSKAACERIIDAERANNGRSLIGFVLRSTPYFSRIHQAVSQGRVGRILSVQADELPGWLVTSVMFRSPWRRHYALSGGSMLEKSCHDMDILNWLIGSRPAAVNSFGGRLVFNPNPELPENCPGCPVADTCKYYQAPHITHEAGEGVFAFRREDLRCIYNIDTDVMDTQSVALEYENGTVANFMLSFHTAGKRAGRNLHIVGTRGRIWGNMDDNEISLFDNRTEKVEDINVATDGTGHGGGDRTHALLLRNMMGDPDFRPDQNAMAGYLSAVMCFAADQSVAERRRIELRYRDNGYIDLV
jgi:predicted dehydrogenase